jgi:hypothetical protein
MRTLIWLFYRIPLTLLILVQVVFLITWGFLLPWYVTAAVLLLLSGYLFYWMVRSRRVSGNEGQSVITIEPVSGVWQRWRAAPLRYPLAFFLVLPALIVLLIEGAFSLLTFMVWTAMSAPEEWPAKENLRLISLAPEQSHPAGSDNTTEIKIFPSFALRLQATAIPPPAPTIYAMPEDACRSLYWALQSVEWACLAFSTIALLWLVRQRGPAFFWILLAVLALSLAGGYRTFGLELMEINGTMSPRSGPRFCDPPDWVDLMLPWIIGAVAWTWFRFRKPQGRVGLSTPCASFAAPA